MRQNLMEEYRSYVYYSFGFSVVAFFIPAWVISMSHFDLLKLPSAGIHMAELWLLTFYFMLASFGALAICILVPANYIKAATERIQQEQLQPQVTHSPQATAAVRIRPSQPRSDEEDPEGAREEIVRIRQWMESPTKGSGYLLAGVLLIQCALMLTILAFIVNPAWDIQRDWFVFYPYLLLENTLGSLLFGELHSIVQLGELGTTAHAANELRFPAEQQHQQQQRQIQFNIWKVSVNKARVRALSIAQGGILLMALVKRLSEVPKS